MYRVWYWQNGEWNMEACGKLGNYAFRLLEAYASFNPGQYRPYVEYLKEKEEK